MAVFKLQFTPSEAAFITGLPIREVQKAIDEDWFDVLSRHSIGGAVRRSLGPAELLHLRIVKDACRYTVLHAAAKKQIHRQLRERMVDVLLAVTDDVVVMVELAPLPHHASVFASRAAAPDKACLGTLKPSLSDVVRRILEQQFPLHENSFRRCVTINIGDNEWDRLYSWFEGMAEHLEPVKIWELTIHAVSTWEQISRRLAEATGAQLAVVLDPEIPGGDPVVRGTQISVHLLHELAQQGAAYDELLAAYPSLDRQRLELALLYARNHRRTGRPKERPWRA